MNNQLEQPKKQWKKVGKTFVCQECIVKKGEVYMRHGYQGEYQNIAWVVERWGEYDMREGFRSAREAKLHAEKFMTDENLWQAQNY